MRLRLLTGIVVVASLVGFGCSGEGNADPTRGADARSENESQDDVDPGDRDLYAEALSRWLAYTRESWPLMTRGQATPESEAVFREYLWDWQREQSLLAQLETRGITFSESAVELWYRPQNVSVHDVEIAVCVAKEATFLKEGVRQPSAGPPHPYVVLVEMTRTSRAEQFRIKTATAKVNERCEP